MMNSFIEMQAASTFLAGAPLRARAHDLPGHLSGDLSNAPIVPVVKSLVERLCHNAVGDLFNTHPSIRAVILDTAPYHRTSGDEQELWQATVVWRRQFGDEFLLTDYHRVVAANVALDLGIFHHPALCRFRLHENSGDIFVPQCLVSVTGYLCPELENQWERLLCERHRVATLEREVDVISIQKPANNIDVACECSWRTFSEIGVTGKMPKFAQGRAERMESVDGRSIAERLKMDFMLINRVNHRRVDEMLGITPEKYISAMIVLPFDVAFNGPAAPELSDLDAFSRFLPDTYLGASWLYLVIDANEKDSKDLKDWVGESARDIVQETLNEVLPQLIYRRGKRYTGEAKSTFAHQTSAVIDSILHSVDRLPEIVREQLGGFLLAKLHLLRATINSYRTKSSRVNRGEFKYPWTREENPLAVYRDIGIQLGFERAKDAPASEPLVREAGHVAARVETQPGSSAFDIYRRRLFDDIPLVAPATVEHLKHSSFAVLILLAIKQAVYHTIRSHQFGNSTAKISMKVREGPLEIVFECTITNPRVTEDDRFKQAKDALELSDLAERLSDIPDHPTTYSIEGPLFDESAGQWWITTRIHSRRQ